MSDRLQRSFDRAQREYENKLPDWAYEKNVPCPDCDGEGRKGFGVMPCVTCDGTGEITVDSREVEKRKRQAEKSERD